MKDIFDIHIGNKIISRKNQPCFIIAEACDNHFGNIENAKLLANLAKQAKADCIKFQHHLPDEEMLPNIPKSDNFDLNLYNFLKKYALTLDQHKELKIYCDKIGISYLCTPFSYQAAVELLELNIDCFKIGSGEFTDITMLKDIVKLNKPMILSTGMCSTYDIDTTISKVFDKMPVKYALLNCTSEYPPIYEDINLPFISKLLSFYPVVIGHSDHTNDNYTSFSAVTLGAKIIEKHFTLDKEMKGPDQSVSIDFKGLKDLVDGIRKIEKAMIYKHKIIRTKEKQIVDWAHRSIVTIKDIKQGEELNRSNIYTKRPGTGIPSIEFENIVGKKASKDIEKNVILKVEDFE